MIHDERGRNSKMGKIKLGGVCTVHCARVVLRKGLRDIFSCFQILNLVRHDHGKMRDPRIKYRVFRTNCWSIFMYCTLVLKLKQLLKYQLFFNEQLQITSITSNSKR